MKSTSLLLSFCLWLACNTAQHKEKTFVATPSLPVPDFRKPVIIQPIIKAKITLVQRQSLLPGHNVFIGSSPFTDTLFIPYIDTAAISSPRNRINDWQGYVNPDTLNFTGLEIVPDYNTNILRNGYDTMEAIAFYPVYLANQTGAVRSFAGKDGYTYAIQEAMDKKGRWYPIETRPFDFCGNGTWLLHIKHGEFVTILFPKYKGNFKTRLRVRLRSHRNIYVSPPYEGTINERQFHLKKDDPIYAELRDDKKGAIHSFFFDAPPLGCQ